MATNYKNTNPVLVTTKRCVPLEQAKTGTVSSTGKIITGTGTLFTTEAQGGQWVYSSSQNEVRRIIKISSATELEIDFPFTTPLVAAPFVVVPASRYTKLQYFNVGGGIAQIDGVNIAAAATGAFEINRDSVSKHDFLDPIIVDGSVSNILLTTTQF